MLDVSQHHERHLDRVVQAASAPAAHEIDRPPAVPVPAVREDEPLSRLLRTAVERRTQQPTIQRSPKSASLLTKLAKPQVLKAPAIKEQREIIQGLEDAIAKWAEEYKAPREWLKQYPDDPQLFLGAIELDGIPESAENDDDLIEASTLVDVGTANSLRRTDYDLVASAGVQRQVVTNTLRTMIAAGQIDYLRESGLPNDEWKILIEVHYTRKRGKNSPQFHKDTLGQTMFVNINYATEDPVAGPEYMVNPPEITEWDDTIAQSLPPVFIEDLKKTRENLDELTEIEDSEIPSHGAVAFVDEAIHHRTPLLGHRTVKGSDLAKFLKDRYGAKQYDDASDAYDKYMGDYWPAMSYSADLQRWFKWIAMARQPNAKFTRPQFLATKMAPDDVDELVESTDTASRTVSIPKLMAGAPQDIVAVDGKKRPPLKRRMSVRAMKNTLPPDVVGDRRFFRTWIRAVKK